MDKEQDGFLDQRLQVAVENLNGLRTMLEREQKRMRMLMLLIIFFGFIGLAMVAKIMMSLWWG
jgi:hypothetical protein